MSDTATYGRTIDFAGNGGAECPPVDIYTWRITKASDPEEKEGFNEHEVDIQTVLDVTLEGYDYDPDEDERDWNGFDTKLFLVLGRKYPRKDKSGNLLEDRDGYIVMSDPSPVWKSTHANARHAKVVRAIFPEFPWDDKDAMKHQHLDLDAFEGRRFRAQAAPNDKGYCRLDNFSPAARQRKQKPAPPPPPVDVDDDDSDLYDKEEA